jgi:hypothetical protein
MSSATDTVNNIFFNICIYVGSIEWVMGTVGNGLTIMVLRQAPLWSTRTATCLMVLAVMNIIYLNHALLTRAMAALYHQFDTTFGNDILCRFRYFVPYVSKTIILSLLSWIAFDR